MNLRLPSARQTLAGLINELWPERVMRRALDAWPLPERMQRGLAEETTPFEYARIERPIRLRIEPGWSGGQIQHALLQMAGDGGGQAVFPPGAWTWTDALRIPSTVTLSGAGPTTELVFQATPFGILFEGTREAPLTDACVRNLSIRHENTGLPGFGAAILLHHARGIAIEDTHIPDPCRLGIFLGDRVDHAALRRLSIRHAGLDGIGLLRKVRDILIEDTLIENCRQSGLLLADWPSLPAAAPHDYEAQARAAGIGFGADDPYPLRIDVLRCVFRKNRKMGVCTDGAGLLSLRDCELADNQCEGVTLDNGTWGARLTDCRIRNNGRRGGQHEEELKEEQVHGDGLLPDGTSKVKLPGVSLDNAAFCRVEQCVIERNHGDGVKFVRAGYACVVRGNAMLSNNRGYSPGHPHMGIRIGADRRGWDGQHDFPGCGIQVRDNDILGAHVAGVALRPGAMNNTVAGNRIAGQTGRAIDDRSRRVNRIEGNRSGWTPEDV